MSDPLGRLFFPLTSFRLPRLFATGDAFLALRVSRRRGQYASTLSKGGKPVKLSLEKIDANDFTQAVLQHYFFRQPDKEYGAHRQMLARLGFAKGEPLEMQYRDQKYVLNLRVKSQGSPLDLQLFYSPSVAQLVARAVKVSR